MFFPLLELLVGYCGRSCSREKQNDDKHNSTSVCGVIWYVVHITRKQVAARQDGS